MANHSPTLDAAWSVGVRVWAERAGQAVLGPGRLELLEQIDRLHSISAAARAMGMSYRHAWEMVRSINNAAGQPLIESATGGAGGGGAILTPFGREAIVQFRAVTERLMSAAAEPARVGDNGTLHLLAAVSLEEVLGRVLADYSQACPAVRVRAVFGASDELAALIRAGSRADLFLSADPAQLNRLQPRPARRVMLAANALAIIAPATSSLRGGRAPLLLRRCGSRIALAVPECPLGGYTIRYLAAIKLASVALRPVIRAENSRGVVAAVRSGQADLGIAYASDVAHAEGCRLLCRIERSPAIRYEAGVIGTAGPDAPPVHLLNFLVSQSARRHFRECGFRPLGRG
jgi:molybdate transport system regulatory protein